LSSPWQDQRQTEVCRTIHARLFIYHLPASEYWSARTERIARDARNVVRFDLIGDGRLIDHLGTSTGARKVELYNGRALITLQRKGEVVVSVSGEEIKTAFLQLNV